MGLFKRDSFKQTKFRGQYVFPNFGYGLYNLDTPRDLSDQLTSLALTGGRNVWSEKGALVSQYGYNIVGHLDQDIPVIGSDDTINDTPKILLDNDMSNTDVAIISELGTIYRYSEIDGLKKYKTNIKQIIDDETDLKAVYYGNQMYFSSNEAKYMFGQVLIDNPEASDPNLYQDVDYVEIIENPRNCDYVNSIVSISITEEEKEFLWLDKPICLKLEEQSTAENPKYKAMYVTDIQTVGEPGIDTYPYKVYLAFSDITEDENIVEQVTIGEKGLWALVGNDDFTWIPEDYDSQDQSSPQPVTLYPKLMAVALNRLWIVNKDNTIYYSQVGNLSKFNEAYGAGYFSGFYGDNSQILSIEEYFSGVLITKQTGMFHIKLTTQEYSYGEGGSIATSTDGNYLTVSKINNITQKYAGDHVIIGDEVIAYENSSGNLIQACFINYFGNPQQGGILLHGSELDVQSLGLTTTARRKLIYSFKEEVLLLYYGQFLDKALLITRGLSIYPREVDNNLYDMTMSFQGYICVTQTGSILDGFKRGTIIPNLTPIAEFEPICLRGNKLLCGTIMEFTELDGIRFNVSTLNAGSSDQKLFPHINETSRNPSENLPNLVYSDQNINFFSDTVAEHSRWASQKSSLTRLAAPLGGRDGLALRLEFEPNVSFCLTSIYFPDMSRGE